MCSTGRLKSPIDVWSILEFWGRFNMVSCFWFALKGCHSPIFVGLVFHRRLLGFFIETRPPWTWCQGMAVGSTEIYRVNRNYPQSEPKLRPFCLLLVTTLCTLWDFFWSTRTIQPTPSGRVIETTAKRLSGPSGPSTMSPCWLRSPQLLFPYTSGIRKWKMR